MDNAPHIPADEDLTSHNLYISAIRQLPQFKSKHEEWLTAQDAREGDSSAARALIENNLRFVLYFVKRYEGAPIPIEDLISTGAIGLMIAVGRFKPKKNVKFISYAVHWVRQRVNAAIAAAGFIVSIPQNQHANYVAHREYLSRLVFDLKRPPRKKDNYLQSSQDLSYELACQLYRVVAPPTDLSPQVEDRPRQLPAYQRQLVIDQDILHLLAVKERNQILSYLIRTNLTNREQEIVQRYYGFNGPSETLAQIGERFDVTRERIRQLRNRALDKLQSTQKLQPLEELY